MKKIIIRLSFFVTMLLMSQQAFSHTTSTSYLNINLDNDKISGVWQVTLKDIHLILGLDMNSDSKLIWSEVISQKQKIISELNRAITIATEKSSCKLYTKKLMIDRRVSSVYLNIPFDTNCQSNFKFSINYNFLFEQDAFHKAILSIVDNKKTRVNILSYTNRSYNYNQQNTNAFQHFFDFVVQGIIHVLMGFDHVLFVICLLLSATLLVNYNQQQKNNLKPLLSNTFKLITAFTIAHSITLILASTKTLSIPPTIIEPVIALSVIVLALLNLFKNLNVKHWPIVFAFGLIHGFGFAFVLEEVPIQSGTLIPTLFGFNLGVELGQLIIVLCILPILYLMNSKKYYHRFIIPLSSVVISGIGLFWLIERTVNYS